MYANPLRGGLAEADQPGSKGVSAVSVLAHVPALYQGVEQPVGGGQ
nr:hypothetical protein [Streptomyces ureilyticus]